MSDTICPRCGETASGNFCASCGAALASRFCTECGAPIEPGARFCTTCGSPTAGLGAPTEEPSGSAPAATRTTPSAAAPTSATPRRGAQSAASTGGDSKLPWIVAGGMFVAMMGMLVYPILRQDEVAPIPVQGGATGGFGNAGAVDLSTMTPIEQANRLFTRVMESATVGDSTQVAFFVPMAIQAYENVGVNTLDTDGLFHLSMLQQTADDLPAAIETAERGLGMSSNHLLLLYAKGEAQFESGDSDGAAATFNQLLDAWDEERATDNIDYVAHNNMFESIEARAREITGR